MSSSRYPSAQARAASSSSRSRTPTDCDATRRGLSTSPTWFAWAYQRQARLDDARNLAVHAADGVERDHSDTPAGLRVWGGLC